VVVVVSRDGLSGDSLEERDAERSALLSSTTASGVGSRFQTAEEADNAHDVLGGSQAADRRTGDALGVSSFLAKTGKLSISPRVA
jgi:hypothetical protein